MATADFNKNGRLDVVHRGGVTLDVAPQRGRTESHDGNGEAAEYVDVWIAVDPTQTHKLWVRLRAEDVYWGNDSIQE